MKISSTEYDSLIRKFPKLKPTEEIKISTPNTHKALIPSNLKCVEDTSWKYESFKPKSVSKNVEGIKFTIPGDPVGKPRQTQSDKWKKRPCVMRYRAWADVARLSLEYATKGQSLDLSLCREVHFIAYLRIPKSYSTKKILYIKGNAHLLRGDCDNFLKSIQDALFKEDGCIWKFSGEKRWDDGKGCRIEVELR